jgi:hypothetical protein
MMSKNAAVARLLHIGDLATSVRNASFRNLRLMVGVRDTSGRTTPTPTPAYLIVYAHFLLALNHQIAVGSTA